MHTLADITSSVAGITASLTAVHAKLADAKAILEALKAQVASGSVVSQADLDALAVSLDAIEADSAVVLAEGTGLATP